MVFIRIFLKESLSNSQCRIKNGVHKKTKFKEIGSLIRLWPKLKDCLIISVENIIILVLRGYNINSYFCTF